ncbi:hypothetical protein ONS95_003324 [Cadophora gregata]|uniref:uncharacterized protein n=1 Tax=Cadophora gregata TaxID=51156 RepID=UPI0026DC326E|nr:uncharacterized protein ONS95_003324 [Cadophora gregata]KAK0108519.1 hypothetical protein ONS95_003324 [Cadophora gregata]
MKLPTLMFMLLGLTSYTSACLHVYGHIRWADQPAFGINYHYWDLRVVDNGVMVCNSQWGARVDKGVHLNINCLPGYIWSTDASGNIFWFRNSADQVTKNVYRVIKEQCWTPCGNNKRIEIDR